MKSVLIITPQYSHSQYIKSLLLRYDKQFQLCGSADNSVLGMSLIESTLPDIVIMTMDMTFWNAEDLINYLLPQSICPTFILLSEDENPTIGDTAAIKVAQILSAPFPADDELLRALQKAGLSQERDTCKRQTCAKGNSAVQHSLEIMELLAGLGSMQIGAAQQEFGRLRVGRQDCWVILGTPDVKSVRSFDFFHQIDRLNDMFNALTALLAPLGVCEICIYRENNLCILLAGGQNMEPDWNDWLKKASACAEEFNVPPLTFDISDVPLPLERWHDQCQHLLQLQNYHFFLDSTYLQPKTVHSYRANVPQTRLHEKLSALSLAAQSLKREQMMEALQSLEGLVGHSLSSEVYAFVSTQLAVQYNSLRFSLNIPDSDGDALFPVQYFRRLSDAFSAYRALFEKLYDQSRQINDHTSQTVSQICGYINKNLAEPLTLEIIAKQAHISPSFLSRLFKRETGDTLNAYINRTRVSKAMRLLETRRTVTDIASIVGFENAKYFSQVFRKYAGKTPQQYRKEIREGGARDEVASDE